MIDQILGLTKRLYPTGRAWRLKSDSNLYRLHEGLAASEDAAYQTNLGILNQILPDNDNFTEDDALSWEIKLQLPISNAPLATRRLAILRKMQYPGTQLARQHYLFIQKQLNDAGFPVFLHENSFPTSYGFYNEFNSFPGNYKISAKSNTTYVTNVDDSAVRLYDTNSYDLKGSFGTPGTGAGEFDEPKGVFAYGDYIYVCDSGNNRIQLFDIKTLEFFTEFGTSGTGSKQFDNPSGICVDAEYIYVTDTGNHRVQVFFRTSRVYKAQVGTLGTGTSQFNGPNGVSVKDDSLYVVDSGNDRVQIFNRHTLSYIDSFGATGAGPGQFNSPFDIYVNANYIYVSDEVNENVSAFQTPDLAFVEATTGSTFDGLKGLTGFGNYLYAVDSNNNRIQVLNKYDGKEVVDVAVVGDKDILFTEHSEFEEHSVDTEHGLKSGLAVSGVIANYLENDQEVITSQTDISLRSTFFIGAETFPNFINLPANREREFRDLVLKLKPLHTYAYLLINFV